MTSFRLCLLAIAASFALVACTCNCPTCPAITSDDQETAKQETAAEPEKQEKKMIPETNDMQEVHDFIKNAKTYYIATVEDGQPRVRPFGTIHIFEGKLYFQTGKKKNVAKQIDANPRVEICAFDGERWIRLAGEVAADERIEAQSSMLDDYPNLKSMYQPGDGNTVVYYFKNAEARISSFNAPERVIKF